MTTLTLVRGLPGSGKSTYARNHALGLHYEADLFFETANHSYVFDPKLLTAAHDWCYANTVRALRWHLDVVVTNTFTKMWELERYLAIPLLLDDIEIKVVEMRTQFQNVHGVPDSKLQVMKARWEQLPEDFPYPVTIVDKTNFTHDWKFKGVNMHKGEYWYKCDRCGKEDWIASYGKLEQIDHGECIATDS